MNLFERLCPAPPSWGVRWDVIAGSLPWLGELGDGGARTRGVVEALAGMDEWRARPESERVAVFAAAVLHDAGRADGEGGHARRGELFARRLLWQMGAPIAWREHVAALVRHQRLPFGALERADLDRAAFRVSLLARNDDLALLAGADARRLGGGALMEEVALFVEYTREIGCLDEPRAFASDHARFEYFRHPGRDPGYAAFDDTRTAVTVMSGLPGAGKDHWIALHRPGVAVVSLDDLRAELGVRPTGDQGEVVAAAYARAREHLRAGTPYVWNATNVTRALRSRAIGLAAGYRARVEVVSVEAPPDVVHRRNRARVAPVPAAVIDRMAARWETPDPTEAHEVRWVLNN
ncbi:AAA family ATPase [Dactylosporangium sp. CA-139066]|uniref:AAA family ATPase n=1 Tax=Dactylosporangium sp. CA-139066 TaxID=3239930 RepID=UPI003D8A1DA1